MEPMFFGSYLIDGITINSNVPFFTFKDIPFYLICFLKASCLSPSNSLCFTCLGPNIYIYSHHHFPDTYTSPPSPFRPYLKNLKENFSSGSDIESFQNSH